MQGNLPPPPSKMCLWLLYCFLNGFLYRRYSYVMIVHVQADQLLPQLLMEQFDTLPSKCRHIELMHEEIWFNKNIKQK